MKRIALSILGIILLGCVGGLKSQNDRPFRIELQAPEDAYPYDVLNLGEKGLVVYFENEVLSKTEINWRFVHYDVFFKKRWSMDIPMLRNMEPQVSYVDSTRIAMLLKYDGKKKPGVFHKFVTIRLKDTVKVSIDLPFVRDVAPNLLYAGDDRAYFSYYNDDKEQFFLLRYADGKTQEIAFPELDKAYVQFVQPIPNSSQLIVCVRNDIGKKANQLRFYRMSVDGLIVSSTMIPNSENVFFNRARAVRLHDDTVMIMGSYVLKNSISGGVLTPSAEQSTGVFTAILSDRMSVDSARYFNFAHNALIFKYLSKKEQEKMKKRLDDPGDRDNLSLNLQILLHEPLKTDSSIVFLVEAYYPEYRTEENVNYDFYGRPFPNNRTYFEGYRYTNAIIGGFNPKGELLWDNNFSLNEVISYDLKPRVALCADSNVVLLAFSNDGNINTAAIMGYTVVQNPERSRIEPMNASDFVIKTEKPQIEHWYKNYFLSYGYQKIRSTGKGTKNRDNAFFLNKMIYKNVD